MSVVIRMTRQGRKKRPFYRIVAADSECKRDGRFLEILGTLDPLSDPPGVELDAERVKYWLGVGAKPSGRVSSIIDEKIPGFWPGMEKARLDKIRAKRQTRKERCRER